MPGVVVQFSVALPSAPTLTVPSAVFVPRFTNCTFASLMSPGYPSLASVIDTVNGTIPPLSVNAVDPTHATVASSFEMLIDLFDGFVTV